MLPIIRRVQFNGFQKRIQSSSLPKKPQLNRIQQVFHYDVPTPHKRHTTNFQRESTDWIPIGQALQIGIKHPFIKELTGFKLGCQNPKKDSYIIGKNKAYICVLDISFAMLDKSEHSDEFTKWEVAKKFVNNMIADMKTNDQLAIIPVNKDSRNHMDLTKMDAIGKGLAWRMLDTISIKGRDDIFIGIHIAQIIIDNIPKTSPLDVHLVVLSSGANNINERFPVDGIAKNPHTIVTPEGKEVILQFIVV